MLLDDAWRDTMLLKIALLLSPRTCYLDLTEIVSPNSPLASDCCIILSRSLSQDCYTERKQRRRRRQREWQKSN